MAATLLLTRSESHSSNHLLLITLSKSSFQHPVLWPTLFLRPIPGRSFFQSSFSGVISPSPSLLCEVVKISYNLNDLTLLLILVDLTFREKPSQLNLLGVLWPGWPSGPSWPLIRDVSFWSKSSGRNYC